jgi:adenosylcobinamide-phosphate guanylyltransferase
MAGGKGKRLGLDIEKPMLEVAGIPMVKRVIDACLGSDHIDQIHVAVSGNTPATEKYVDSLGLARVSSIRTPGLNYHEDMKQAIRNLGSLGSRQFLVVSADLPFLEPRIIDEVAIRYLASQKPALVVLAPLVLFMKMGLKPSWVMKVADEECVPCGINVVDGSRIGEAQLEEEVLVIRDPRACANVNSPMDLEALRREVSLDPWVSRA